MIMRRVSSNVTILLKIFIPTVWISFFGLLTLTILLSDGANLPMGGSLIFKLGTVTFYLFFLVLMYFTIMKLKRVDFGEDGIYVSNYFKTYRYKYEDIASINENNMTLFHLGTILLKAKGKFGKKIRFIISKANYEFFIEQNPDLFIHLT